MSPHSIKTRCRCAHFFETGRKSANLEENIYNAYPCVSRQRLRSASKRPSERDSHVTSGANVLPEGRQDPGSR
ncbi:hypothetical protein GJAV_G00152340 [Gymnothorax javanicus]|nr:hypothetical protein GJAV_G00152340 [Gymnothorax javanicus]